MTHNRPSRFTRLLGVCSLAAIAALTPAALAQGRQAPNDKAFRMKVNDSFGLLQSEIISLDLSAKRGEGLFIFVPIGGLPTFLNLQPYSVRGANYQLLVQQPDGSLLKVAPGRENTLRGDVIGLQDVVVAGSLLDDGLHATIRFKDGSSLWIEPIGDRVAGAGANQHVLYRNEDVIQDAKVCGVNDMMRIRQGAPGLGKPGDDSIVKAAAGTCIAELACDADFEYFSAYGSVAAVESRINAVVNAVNVQYERDVNISHVITTIIVRTSEPDPYTSTDAVTLLTQFRNYWLANHTNIQRDLAQLFTGKNVDSNTIGVAWLNAVCTSHGFSMVQSDFSTSFACATDLSAHEMGHNWGADHCRCWRPTAYTMNPFITCANQFHSRQTIPEIIAFRDSRTCLTDCGGGDPPPPPPDGCTSDPVVAEHTCGPGAKRNDCLIISIRITCDGAGLEDATVAVRLDGSSGDVLTGSAKTNGNGEVSFRLRCRQAVSSSYISTITSINGVAQDPTATNVRITGCTIN